MHYLIRISLRDQIGSLSPLRESSQGIFLIYPGSFHHKKPYKSIVSIAAFGMVHRRGDFFDFAYLEPVSDRYPQDSILMMLSKSSVE